ncbi:MAG: glutathione-disulfide reductase [Pseudomonadota bacterium]
MSEFDFDLFVIGGGSGGVRAARVSAQAGARVAVAEEFRFGGTCVIRGCVPKKLMVYASAFSELFEDAAGFGWEVGECQFHWDKLCAARDAEVTRLEGLYEAGLHGAGATTFHSRATLADAHTVRLASGETVSASHILVATGGWPVMPDIPGIDQAISSNEVFHMPRLPTRMVIVGGGYVACEFAGVFNGLGSDVVHVHRRPEVLRGFDADLRTHVTTAMAEKGITQRFEANVTAIEGTRGALTVRLDDGSVMEAEEIMFATGRTPNTAGLGLEEVGVRLTANGAVAVDSWSQSSVPSIYAVGDVTDRLALTPVAIREGQAFAETVFRSNPLQPDHETVATAIFTQPEIGTVGLSEEDARAAGHALEIYRATFRPMMATLSGRSEKMLMKLVVDAATRRVLGCHILGHGAGEMIQLAGVALKMGATKEDFDRTVAVHPTAAEELVTMRSPVAQPAPEA